MPKFIIYYDIGYGKICEVVEAENHEVANDIAYQSWREEAESSADYGVQPYTKERAVDEGLEDEQE